MLTSAARHAAQLIELLRLDLGLKLERALAFRLNFFAHSAIALGHSFAFSLVQLLLYARLDGYPGWSPQQMLLFQALLLTWTGTSELLFGGVRAFVEREVAAGSFDRVFLWPAPALVSVLSRGTNVYAAPTVLAGALAVAVLVSRAELSPPLLMWALAAACFVAGLVFYAALLVVYAACTLFMVEMERLREVLERVAFFGSFPADLYAGSAAKAAVLVVFPIGLWAYFPAQVLLERASALAAVAALMAVVLFAGAVAFYARQERRYVSAGG